MKITQEQIERLHISMKLQKLINDEKWGLISECYVLSEPFIREFSDKVDWCYISKYQKLSEPIIREFSNKVYWCNIYKYQNLSESFIDEFRDMLVDECVDNSWHYKPTEYKKAVIQSTNLYECHDDYFIAYKGIRSDNWSAYNFQYQYFVGSVYESWADYSNNEDSFGLSVWTYDAARNYCDKKIIKVKVRYEDVARVIYHNSKIRCCRFEVLEEVNSQP